MRFFNEVPITDFLFGLEWSPQTAIRSDQVGASGAFGAVPLFAGTMLISAIAMLVAFPIGLMSSIYLAEYASSRARAVIKPVLEILAGIPTVVYGFFAALFVAPAIRDFGSMLGLSVASESALAAGLVMGIMIIPFVSSISDDVITAVPQAMREGSYGLGATQSETIRKVIIPAALPGIVGGVLLAVSRAIGETMIVVMAAGLAANLTANPLEAVTTVTVQIVSDHGGTMNTQIRIPHGFETQPRLIKQAQSRMEEESQGGFLVLALESPGCHRKTFRRRELNLVTFAPPRWGSIVHVGI